MSERIREDNLPESPYPGIDPFSYADRDVFFARETEARTLIRLIVMYRGVLLYSGSGTGKSSLVNSGLIPLAKDEGYNSERIRVQPKKGEEIVIERLSERVDGKPPFLPSVFASDELQERVVLSVEQFLETLSQMPMPARPLLIFDQFEEWITLFEEGSSSQTAKEVRAIQEDILDAIVSLVNNSALPVKVLIVLREDYLAKLAPLFEQCPNLPDQYLRLTSLKADQVYQVIRRPFERYPEKYSSGVSDCLAKKIQTEFEERVAGADIRLTEVQIVCHTLFETGKQGPDLDQLFVDEGGVQGILEKYLKRALESLKDNQQDPAVALLSRMVTSAGTRNVISEDDLISRVQLEDGIQPELLGETLNSLETETKLVRRELRHKVYYYEIASEFLVGWISKKTKERERSKEQKKLKQARNKSEQRAEEQTKIARRRLYLAIAMSVMFMIAIGAVACVWVLKDNAQHMRYTSVADSLLKEAPQQREQYHRHELAALMTVQAYRFYEGSRKLGDTSFPKNVFIFIGENICKTLFKIPLNISSHETLAIPVKQELRKALETSHFSDYLRGDSGNVRAIKFICKGKKLTSCSATGVVRVWELKDRSSATLPLSQSDNVSIETATYSSDGKNLALGRGDGTILLYDLQKPSAEPNVLKGHKKSVLSVAFSFDGKKLASGSADGTIRLWDVQNHRELSVLPGHKGNVLSLSFSRDGRILASGSADKTVRLWDVQKPGVEPNVLKGHKESVLLLAFNPNCPTLLSCSADGTMHEWDVSGRNTNKPMPLNFKGNVLSVEYSPRGRYLALGMGDCSIWLWDLEKPNFEYAVLNGHENRVLSVAFSPDEKTLASGDAKGNILKWHLQNDHSDSSKNLREELMKGLLDRICKRVSRNLTLSEWRQFVGRDIPYQPTWPDLKDTSFRSSAWENLARDGSIEKAVEYFDEVLKMDLNSSVDPKTEATNKKESWRLFEKGKEKIANEYDVDGGIEEFDKALKGDPDLKLEIVQVKKRLGELLVEKAKEFTIAGDVDNGTELFAEALKLYPDLDGTIKEAKRNAAQKLAGEAVDNIIDGEVNKAIAIYKKAENLDPTLRKSGPLLNNLCLWGSLWKKPGDVMSFCDRAVGMNQSGGSFHGSRAIALAVKDDVNGAIKDYEKYLKWAKPLPEIDTTGPEKWLTVLGEGGKITDEMIEKTRNDLIEMTREQARAMSMSRRQSAVTAQ